MSSSFPCIGGALLLAALAVLTPASASGTVDVGALIVSYDNRATAPCLLAYDPFCIATAKNSDNLGDAEVGLRQQVSYVGVATRLELVSDELGIFLLPDHSISVHGSDFYVAHPGLQTITEGSGGRLEPPVLGGMYSVTFAPQNVTVTYFGPTRSQPTTPPRMHNYSVEYNDRLLGYDRVGIPHQFYWEDSDYRAYDAAAGTCSLDPMGQCAASVVPAVNATQATTPNILLGFEFYEAEIVTDPALLGLETGELERAEWSDPSRPAPTETAYGLKIDSTSAPSLPLEDSNLRVQDLPAPGPAEGGPVDVEDERASVKQPASTLVPRVVTAAVAITTAIAVCAFVLYSRLRKRQVLDHVARSGVLAVVQTSPGIMLMTVAKTVGLSKGATQYHVRVLEREGLVRVERIGRRTLIRATTRGGEVRLEPLLNLEGAKGAAYRILAQSESGLTRRELHHELREFPLRTRNHAMLRLRELNIVTESLGASGERVLKLTPGWAAADRA